MKHFATLIAACCLYTVASAQIYFNASAGYGIPVQKMVVAQGYHSTSSNIIFEGMYASLGGGITYGFNAGYKLKDRWLFEFACATVNGDTMKSEYIDEYNGVPTYTVRRFAHGKVFNLIPTIGIAGDIGRVGLYSRSGFVIGLNPHAWLRSEEADYNMGGPSMETETEEVQSGNLALGFNQRIGASMNVWKGLTVSLELSGLFQTWSPRYGERTKQTANGVNQLENASYSYTHFEYVDSYDQAQQISNPPERTVRLKNYYSFSSASVLLSVGYSFGAAE